MSDETLDLFGADAQPASGSENVKERPEDAPRAESAGGEAVLEDPVLTVSELNRQVRRLLESRYREILVAGEIGTWSRGPSGHCYFRIKDADAELDCVLFRDAARRLPIDPTVGMEVRLRGRVSLYEAGGRYQLIARELVPLGDEGLYRMAFEKLRLRLTEEGLIDPTRRRPLPKTPRRVGVVTSTRGAALRDILHVIERRAPWTEVVVAGARVQGEGSAVEIAEALGRMGRWGRVDVIIVGRGGGSLEDLWAFNEEPVARAIAASPVPVVSAVGHETDHTIADLVADLRAPTPSAGAEAAVPDGSAIREYVRRARPRLRQQLRRWVELREAFIGAAPPRLARAVERRLDPARRRLDRAHQGIRFAVQSAVDRRRQRLGAGDRLAPLLRTRLDRVRAQLNRAAGRLDALSPLGTLDRGFAVATDESGRVLRGVAEFEEGRSFILRVADGRVRARSEGAEGLDG